MNQNYVGLVNPSRCECHECTQARWKMSLQGQMSQSQTQALPKLSQDAPIGYTQTGIGKYLVPE